MHGFGPHVRLVELEGPRPAVRGETAGVDGVGLTAIQLRGKVQVKPVLLGVVGAGVDRQAVLPAVNEPREVGAFAFAANALGRTWPGIGRVFGAGNAVARRTGGDGQIERAGDDPFVRPRHAALVVDDMAFVEVEHHDTTV